MLDDVVSRRRRRRRRRHVFIVCYTRTHTHTHTLTHTQSNAHQPVRQSASFFLVFFFFLGGLLPFHWLPLTSSARFSSSPRLIRVSFAYAKRFMPHLHTLVLLYNQGLLLFRRGPRRRTPIKRELATLLLVVSVFETLICICKATGSVFLLVLFFLDKMADWGPSFA